MKIIKTKTMVDEILEIRNQPLKENEFAFRAIRTYEDESEFLESDDLKNVYDGYAPSTLHRAKKIMKHFVFIIAYVLDDGSIYRVYEQPNGIKTLREVSPITMLSCGGVYLAQYFEDSFIIDQSKMYNYNNKDKAQIQSFLNRGLTISF